MNEDRWLFFDLGWTLVDETEAHLERLERLRRIAPQYSNVEDEDFLRLCESHASRFAPSPFLAALQTVDPTYWESSRELVPYNHARERLYIGVPDVLRRLRERFHLGLIANQSAGTAARLQEFGIYDFFSVIISSTEAGISKPDPRIFTHAQSLAGCSPAHATMVGDRLDNDISPAKTCGWRTVRVLQGFSRHQVPRNDNESPDHTVASVVELTLQEL